MNRPRWGEWLPLSTQQLRLRNVIRILGVNIECVQPRALLYYTLHHTHAGSAIYTSEKLPQRHPQLKWAEITCVDMLKSNSNCVCIKVWARSEQTHRLPTPTPPHTDCIQSALTAPHSDDADDDQLLFSWGVYFSGLIVLTQLVDAMCSANSLIFQINGEYFASPDHLSADHLRQQLSVKCERLSASLPQNSLPPPDASSINSPRGSRSTSPVAHDLLRMSKARYVQLNYPTKEVRVSYSLQQLLRLQELQRRHMQLVRESVDVADDIKQLSVRCVTLQEQLAGRRRRRTTSAMQQHNQQYHSMGRTLSVLLAEQQQADPQQLLRAQRLQQDVETLRARQRMLQRERDAYANRMNELRQRLGAVEQQRCDLQAWLNDRHQQMADEQMLVQEQQDEVGVLQQAKRRLILSMKRRMAVLCLEMREIYTLSHDAKHFHTVCGIPFPSGDMYPSDANSQASSANADHVTPMALSASLGYVAHLVQMLAIILNRPLRNPIVHEGSHSRIMDLIKNTHYASREYPLYSRSSSLPNPVKYAIDLLNQNIAQLCFDITGRDGSPCATIENIAHIFRTLEKVEHNQSDIGDSMIHFRGGESGNPFGGLDTNCTAVARAGGGGVSVCVDAVDGAVGGLTLDGRDIEILSKSNSSDMNHVLSPPTALSMTVAADNIAALFEPLPDGASQSLIDRMHAEQRSCRSEGSYSDREEEEFEDNAISKHYFSNSDSHLNVKRGGRI